MNYTLYLKVHVLNTISEYSENLYFEYNLWKIFLYGFTIKPSKCLCRWQSCFKSFALKCEVETDRFECSPKTSISTTACMSVDMIQLECSPKTVISTPTRVNVDMSHLEGVEVEIALGGFTKQSISLLISWCFLSLCYISLGVAENKYQCYYIALKPWALGGTMCVFVSAVPVEL